MGICVAVLPHVEMFRKELLPLLRWTPLVVLPIVLLGIFLQIKVINSNKTIDEKINSVCELHNTEFQKKGYSIQYRTKWTGFCKPKHASPERAVVFVAVPEYVESQEVQNTDPIDRKEW